MKRSRSATCGLRLSLRNVTTCKGFGILRAFWRVSRGEGSHVDQWNRTGIREINPHLYGQLIFDKVRTYKGVKIVYSINGVGKTGQICAKK